MQVLSHVIKPFAGLKKHYTRVFERDFQLPEFCSHSDITNSCRFRHFLYLLPPKIIIRMLQLAQFSFSNHAVIASVSCVCMLWLCECVFYAVRFVKVLSAVLSGTVLKIRKTVT
jgi:hypothetical protein